MKKKVYILCFSVLGLVALQTKAQIITTIAGNGTFGFSGDGSQATAAEFSMPEGVATDTAGKNIYVADFANNRIRKIVSSTGIITTVAGGGSSGLGDGGQATAAELNMAQGVAVDNNGNIYIADTWDQRIRKVDASTGIINTVAGNGTNNFSGDGGQATSAEINFPNSVALDTSGNIYFSDQNNNRIRKITVSTGIITTVAGNGTNGFSGDGAQATDAEIGLPTGLAVDASGNIYISDQNNSRIRKVDASTGIITTVAGNGTYGYSGDGGQATATELRYPQGLAIDTSGNIYFADQWNARVRKITISTGIITTVAGDNNNGFGGDGGPATAAELSDTLSGVAVDNYGNIYIGDQNNQRIRKVHGTLTGINTISASANQINIYPNPNNGNFIVSAKGISGKSVIELYNVLGQEIYNTSLYLSPGGNYEINTGSQPSGIYLYRIISNDGNMLGEGKLEIEK